MTHDAGNAAMKFHVVTASVGAVAIHFPEVMNAARTRAHVVLRSRNVRILALLVVQNAFLKVLTALEIAQKKYANALANAATKSPLRDAATK